MKWKKSGARNNPKRGVLIPAPVPCLSNVRNSLSLIRRKSTDSDHKGIETLETNSPSTSSSVSIAQTSMESLCRIGDEGIYGKDESSYSSIERTRDASFKSPKLFGLDDSISSVSRDNLHVHPIKRKAVLHGTSETGSSQIKNSTMNQSAIEAGTMAIDNVSPIKDHKGKRKRGRSSPWSFPDEGQTFQEPSSIETGCRDKIPTHIHAFMKKFQNVGQQHEDSPDTPSDDEDLENWSQIKPQDKISLCEWLSPKQLAKKTLRTFSHKDRRSAFEKCPDEIANFPGESYRTSSPAAPINDAASSKNMDLNLQFSSIRECREDSEVPLGRERTKKNTVNSEEIAADSEDYPSADCLTKGGAAHEGGLIEIGDVVLQVNSTDLRSIPYQDALIALRAVQPDQMVTLLLKVRDGYSSKLETRFDSEGRAKICRVTEPTKSRSRRGFGNNFNNPIPPLVNGLESCGSNHEVTTDYSRNSSTRSAVAPLPPIPRSVAKMENLQNGIAPHPSKQTNGPTVTNVLDQVTSRSTNKTLSTKFAVVNQAEDTIDSAIMARIPICNTPELTVSPQKSPLTERKLSAIPRSPSSTDSPAFTILKNWETGERINDALYFKANATTGCTRNKCIGSVMNPDHMTTDPRKHVRTEEQKIEVAVDFIKQYYGSMKRKNAEMEQKRLAEVVDSIKRTGTYHLSEYELTFGAKTAWRNAPRCIGRIQWNKLQVFDHRHVDNTAQMFDAICNHLKYATNKGNIRSCITFFPQRTDDYKKDFRVWNSQYLLYAGYKQPDGSVIGDPNNVEFTELCVNLGWKPGGGRFDVLPLVLQANGEDPDLYNIPKDIILEVQLRHPRFDWFRSLGLKWVAVPAVSNIMLDIGGIEFPAAPFNGWFMGTEIARDLCDTSRYNVLESVAKKMNLDTRNASSLWKDVALVEFNIAVLYSFQSERVTIMDHHSACESFMKHFANEMKSRGGCPGDWVWLTPPISGSLTPIFHQEILNYSLNPSCQYQPNPWKYHVWKGGSGKTKKAIRFKELAKSVLLMSAMMGKAMANRVKCTILYATETGKSLEYANSLKDIFNHAFAAKVICMEDYDMSHLDHETLLLVVTSTFGNGDPPENGTSFAQALLDLTKSEADQVGKNSGNTQFSSIHNVTRNSTRLIREPSQTSLDQSKIAEAAGYLSNVRFAVFGLGSRAYPNFCAFAHVIDTLLGELQGERLLEVGEGDELCGQEETFRDWAKHVFNTACETFCVGEDVSLEAASKSLMGEDRSWSSKKFRVSSEIDETDVPEICEGLAKYHNKKISVCSIKATTNLQSKESGRVTMLVELDCPESGGIEYHPGDHLGIYPCNQPDIVDRILSRLSDNIDENIPVQLEMFQQRTTALGTISNWVADKRLPACTLRCAFERYLDITTCPTPLMLKHFSDCASDEKEKARLLELSEGKSEYEEWKFHHMPNLPEVLDEFKSVKVEASLLLSQLHPLQCRYYSISSSPAVHQSKVHLTVAVVSYNTQGGEGPLHFGVCSSYLHRASSGDEICCFIRPAVEFRLPADATQPILLIGPGTGIAPFRSFWQQRKLEIEQGNACGEMALLFGCRHPEQDHLYKAEVLEAHKCGAITRYETAFSRLPQQPKQYVQHVLQERLADLAYDWLIKRDGHLYICGDVTMADCVNKSLVKVLTTKGDFTEKQALDHITRMKESRQLHEDIFGVTLRTFEVNNQVRQRHMSKRQKRT